jgi:hypothetical protein
MSIRGLFQAIIFGSVAMVLGAAGHYSALHLDERAAGLGFSPEQVAVLKNHPEWFPNDFPSGALETLKSIIFQVYPIAESAGLPVSGTWAFMILLEIAVFSAAAVYATRRLFPNEPWVLAAFVALLCAVGTLVRPDIGRFQFPYFGWMYGFAYACSLVAAVSALRGQLIGLAVALVAAFLIHPITAIFAGVFALTCIAVQMSNGKRFELGTLAGFAGGVLVPCGAWLIWLSTQGTIFGGEVDPHTFVALTKAQSYHWYPEFLGVFWELHQYHLLPLLATLAMIAWSFRSVPLDIKPQLAAGICVLLIVCITGILIAGWSEQPFLIKLCLQRADSTVMLIGAPLIIKALFDDFRNGDLIERGLAAVLMLLPLISEYGLLPCPVLLRIAYAAAKATRAKSWPAELVVAVLLSAIVLVLYLVYYFAGLIPNPGDFIYLGLNGTLLAAGVISALWASEWLVQGQPTRPMLLLGAMVLLGLLAAPRGNQLSSASALQQATDALDAQIWARDHTPVGSLFMVDPALSYMWRDKSHRPSFGTPREWLLVSIMYNSRKELLDEGMRRYKALGLPAPDYIYDPANRRMGPLLARLADEASARYYAFSRIEIERLAGSYGIRYFVYQKTSLKAPPPLPVAYENAHFVISALP